MKKIFFIILAILMISAPSFATTTVSSVLTNHADFAIVTITVTADGSGGAVTDQKINLSSIYNGGHAYSLYMVETIPSATAAPDAYTLTFQDADTYSGDTGNVLALSARSTTNKEWADASEDLPNYWPCTGDLYLTISDIGASNSTTIKLIFWP